MQRSLLQAVIVSFLLLGLGFAQQLSLQGVLRDDTGASVSDGSYTLTLKLYSVESGGFHVWTEDQMVQITNGVYSLNMGAVNALDALDYNVQYWLGIAVNSASEMTPRTKLTLSPYAVIAGVAGVDNVFPQSGNVGIGTASPNHQLHIEGGVNEAVMNLTTTGYPNGFDFLYGLDGHAAIWNRENSFIHFGTNGAERMRITANGRISMGNATPPESAQLTVKDQAGVSWSLVLQNPDNAYTSLMTNHSTGNFMVGFSDGGVGAYLNRVTGLWYKADGAQMFALPDHSHTSFTSLGIGTSTPGTSKLKIVPDNENDAQVAAPPAIEIKGVDQGLEFGVSSAYNMGTIRTWNSETGATPLLINIDGGNVGIGTVSPSSTLTVKGTVEVQGQTGLKWYIYDDVNGYLHFVPNSGVHGWISRVDGAWHSASDATLKEGVSKLSGVLDKVRLLRPVDYHFKSNPSKRTKNIGFIAQEVEKVFPTLVSESEGKKGVAYSQFGVLAIAAIQEQQAIIEDQAKKIEDMEARLAAIEAKLNK